VIEHAIGFPAIGRIVKHVHANPFDAVRQRPSATAGD